MRKFINLKKENEENINNENVKEETEMENVGFFKRHWKGLTAGAVALTAAVIGCVALGKKSREEDDFEDYADSETEEVAENSESSEE